MKNTTLKLKRYKVVPSKSNRYFTAQAIDGSSNKTVCAVSFKEVKEAKKIIDQARRAGEILSKKLLKKGIKKVFISRNKLRYTGALKEFCESLRKNKINV